MEGFLDICVSRAQRALLTRSLVLWGVALMLVAINLWGAYEVM
jgi:hypothetical protein